MTMSRDKAEALCSLAASRMMTFPSEANMRSMARIEEVTAWIWTEACDFQSLTPPEKRMPESEHCS